MSDNNLFPMKHRRKHLRIDKKVSATFSLKDDEIDVVIVNLSAGGCKIRPKNKKDIMPEFGTFHINFYFSDICFDCDVEVVRKNCLKFLFNDLEVQRKLNELVLNEYFKNEPEILT